MGDDGNWWDPYCPCRVTRKNIVMTCLAICCFALVAWTVVVTGQPPADGGAKNVSYVFVDDTKSIKNLNFTLSSSTLITKAKMAAEKKSAAIEKAATAARTSRQAVLRTVRSPANESVILCKCMCDLQVTAEEMLEAIQHIVEQRTLTEIAEADRLANMTTMVPKHNRRRKSTTPVPTTTIMPPIPKWKKR